MGVPNHKITICTSCKYTNEICHAGYKLIKQLCAAIDLAGDTITDAFEISGTACMAGCTHPCTIAYHSTRKATYLFGDIESDQAIGDLIEFAQQYAILEDDRCSSTDRLGKLRAHTLAKTPAMMLAVENSKALLS